MQELLTPRDLEFFDKRWNYVGSKSSLQCLLLRVTQIPTWILGNPHQISSVPLARRMSWAAKRQTTRVEDVTYSLLGLFGVDMPLLYGEGQKASLRLQQEIMLRYNDRSISAFNCKNIDRMRKSLHSIRVDGHHKLFAVSPEEFANCSNFENAQLNVDQSEAFTLTNRGLYFRRVKLLV